MRLWLLLLAAAPMLPAAEPPAWQVAAGGKMSFEVASVKLNPPGKFTPPPFPLDAGDAYVPTGGHLFATLPVWAYIQFAYKIQLTRDQIETMIGHFPKWVENDRFAIDARAGVPNPTKDQMRLMMQTLLAERFRLAAHFDTQTVPVFAMALAKTGKTGPALRPHSDGPPCDKTGPDLFPPTCDVYMLLKRRTGIRAGSRNTTLELLASSLSGYSAMGRPVVDQTGLSGRYDFVLDWMPEQGPGEAGGAASVETAPESQSPPFLEAVREQLGLKLEPTKAPIQVLIVDHLERPTEN